MSSQVLRWIARALIGSGAALGLWSVLILGEQTYFNQLPPPEPAVQTVRASRELPGEYDRNLPRPADLTRGKWLGRLEGPSIRLSAAVLEGTDDTTLRRGAGHIEDTATPGTAGNVGIAGHRDTI